VAAGTSRRRNDGVRARVVRVCFVCLGNICRSPTAEAVMRHLVREAGLAAKIAVTSAGTGDWHVGEPRDKRSRAVGAARGIPLEGVAHHFTSADFARHDYVLAMDRANRDELLKLARSDADEAKVRLLRSFDASSPHDAEVPDPYYGGARGFEDVFDLCEAACRGLIDDLKRKYGL
jgi:protein-tyrosine phosphatase